ncbi:hypothetical protein [Pseudonocardia sp. TRM90224]|uniref:hypothetical protein n=1 Tax=Pseudonocardia sp. TRM90224 TaxID=2812678 RepID=UPI001E5FFEC6|nr:hypothetical protein [Pseudonocardia sp. TRM90224]
MRTIFDIALWLAAVGHFTLLTVSVNVPRQLKWRTELAVLSPMNRKLLWIYGGYVVFTYLAFAVLTLVLHDELLNGDKAALALAIFIGLYWLVRLAIDPWMGKSAWPKGRFFTIAYIALDLLFAYFACTYLGLAIWHAVT